MNKITKAIIAVVMASALLTARGQDDPVALFERIVNRMPSVVDLGGNHHEILNVRFDVRKTDSLVAPLAGSIDYTVRVSSPRFTGSDDFHDRLQFNFVNGRWVFAGLFANGVYETGDVGNLTRQILATIQ